jgi:putative ABC transport system substrate-binding protein
MDRFFQKGRLGSYDASSWGMGAAVKRRDFLGALGGATMAWPMVARAQAMPVIGVLSARSPNEGEKLLAAFRRGLAENGIAEGQNATIEYRWALGEYDRLPAMAADLVQRSVAVIATLGGEAAVRAASAATKTIPVVGIFASDPVATGLVASLGRPGGNVTGAFNFNPALEPKRIGLLHELMPQAATVGVFVNPNYPPAASQAKGAEDGARSIGMQTVILRASNDKEIEAAFETAVAQQIRVLAVTSDPFFNTRTDKLVALAARTAIPTMYPFREYPAAGGLMSYGVDLSDMYRQVGIYTGRTLKGTKPADLPVIQPVKFEFVINLKAAKALGVKFSDNLMSLADDVIE